MKKISAIASLFLTLGMAAQASADSYVGSACSFADNPLASHNKINHRLQNTSGASQWVTCPITRRGSGNVGHVSFFYASSSLQFARLETRIGGGTVAGWDPEAAPRSSTSGGFLSDWFTSGSGNLSSGAQLVLEGFLGNNNAINGYVVSEL